MVRKRHQRCFFLERNELKYCNIALLVHHRCKLVADEGIIYFKPWWSCIYVCIDLTRTFLEKRFSSKKLWRSLLSGVKYRSRSTPQKQQDKVSQKFNRKSFFKRKRKIEGNGLELKFLLQIFVNLFLHEYDSAVLRFLS